MPCLAVSVATMRTSLISFLLVIALAYFPAQDPVETIRIDSDLVDLKVSVLGFAPNMPAPLLEQKDFVVLEDGVPQEITFFCVR